MHRRANRRGHTLLEALVSTGMLTLLAGGTFAVLRDSGAIFGASVREASDQREVDLALETLVRELEQASAATCRIDATAPDSDTVRFQLPLDLAQSPITLGATTLADGKSTLHPGAWIEWTSRECKGGDGTRELLRRVVAADGATLLHEEALCGGLDRVDAAGRKSFVVTLVDRHASLTLRRRCDDMNRSDADGTPLALVVRSLRLRSL